MLTNNKDQLRKSKPYVDKPNSFNGNIRGTIGIIVLILFVSAFIYLVITGIPTMRPALDTFIQTTDKFLNINH